MKKIACIGIAVATAMGFTACQKEDIPQDRAEGQLISETFTATLGQEATKTAISADAKTVTWAEGDKVHYYTKDGGSEREFTIDAAGSSATLTLEREEGDTYYNLVYAGNANPTFTTKTGESMVFDGVKSAQDGTFANANVSVARTTPEGSGVTFKPIVSIVKFTTARTDIKTIVLTGGNGEKVAGNISVDPTADKPVATLNGTGESSITVTIATPAAGTYYIGVIPGTYTNGLKLTLKDVSGGFIGTVTASKSTDLSAGDAMINYGDVDSHIQPLLEGKFSVGTSKQVQFTRGNLYWDGSAFKLETSQTAYPTSWDANHVGHLYWTKDAVNSYAESYDDGDCATSDIPFFAESKGGLTVEGTDGLFALSSAEWAYLINTRTVNGGTGEGKSYRRATVNSIYGLIIYPDSYTAQTAAQTYTSAEWTSMESVGCVFLPIAGTRANSTTVKEVNQWGVYWSSTPKEDVNEKAYRLTFSDSYFQVDNFGRSNGYSVRLVKDCTPTYTEGTYTGKAVRANGIWWAPVNCGYEPATSSPEYKGYPYGKLYQWGRKDGQGYDGNDATYPSGDKLVSMPVSDIAAVELDKFYNAEYIWYGGTTPARDELWGASKTDYDPCPVGWRVPTSDELGNLVYSDWNPSTQTGSTKRSFDFSSGYGSIDGLALPAAGYRSNSGVANDRGAGGYYWSSSVGGGILARHLSFSNSDVNMKSSKRPYGYSVRCVQE